MDQHERALPRERVILRQLQWQRAAAPESLETHPPLERRIGGLGSSGSLAAGTAVASTVTQA